MKNSRAPLGAKNSEFAPLPAAVRPAHGMGCAGYAATSDEEVRQLRLPPSSVILVGALPAPARSGAASGVAPVGGNLGRRRHALATASAINRRRRRPFVLYFQDRTPRRLGFSRCCPQAVEFGIG